MGPDGNRVQARFARGCRCFAVVVDGEEVIAYGWLSTRSEWIGELSLEFTPDEGEAYIWNCFTLAPHRRLGMYRALLHGIVARAREEGLSRLWIGSIDDPAEKADADAGFAPVLHLTVTAVAGIRLVRARPAPGAHVGLVEAARERMGLRSWRALGPSRHRIH